MILSTVGSVQELKLFLYVFQIGWRASFTVIWCGTYESENISFVFGFSLFNLSVGYGSCGTSMLLKARYVKETPLQTLK